MALSETAADFKRITICFKTSDGQYGSTTVEHPDGKNILLSSVYYSDGAKSMYTKSRAVTVSGTGIATFSGREGTLSSSTGVATTEKCIAITQVIGWRI